MCPFEPIHDYLLVQTNIYMTRAFRRLKRVVLPLRTTNISSIDGSQLQLLAKQFLWQIISIRFYLIATCDSWMDVPSL